jgi:parallel beta-helix repeat protein
MWIHLESLYKKRYEVIKTKEKRIWIVFFLICMLIFFSTYSNITNVGSINYPFNEISQLQYTSHAPIYIDGDGDFTGFPGSGTEGDPYIIENYGIHQTEWYEPCIEVKNTAKYFIIRDNLVTADYWSAIRIENVTSGTAEIVNNICEYCAVAIAVLDTNSTKIIDNDISYSFERGINILSSTHTYITGNTVYFTGMGLFYYPTSCSVYLEYSHNSILLDNSFIKGGYNNLQLKVSDDVYIYNNTFSENTPHPGPYSYGFELNFCDRINVVNNTISDTERCIVADQCDYGIYENNTLSKASEYGFYVTNSAETIIIGNLIQGADLYGINLQSDALNSTIYHNTFRNNNVGGTSQAYDSGTNNIWYNVATSEGNWWNDWTGGTYSIDGESGSEDLYPLGTPVTVPEFLIQTGLFLLTIPVFGIIVIAYKKKR